MSLGEHDDFGAAAQPDEIQPAPAIPPQPGLSAPGPTEAELIEAQLADEHESEPEPLQLTGEAVLEDDEPAGGQVMRIEDTVEALPALARMAGTLWLRAAAWGVGTSLRVGARMARAASDPVAAAELVEEMSDGLRAYAREFLGISELDQRVERLTPLAGATMPRNGHRPHIDLRQQGAELLKQSADVAYEDGSHPAYARILSELAPDEARILRLLNNDGPQPMVDVRAANLIGLGSQLIVPGLNMIGPQAGVRWHERVPAYLNNLGRLGLIYVSDDPVPDQVSYQVLEAQPDVLGVIKDTARAKTVHRSVRLTPFGEDFCRVCLPLEATAAPLGDPVQLPEGASTERDLPAS